VDRAEWLACTDPQPMLEFLRGKASGRKLRLFAVACCRRIGSLLRDRRSRQAVEVAERYADGLVDEAALEAACRAARLSREAAAQPAFGAIGSGTIGHPGVTGAAELAAWHDDLAAAAGTASVVSAVVASVQSRPPGILRVAELGRLDEGYRRNRAAEQAVQCSLLRDNFGDPFNPMCPDPAWRSALVIAIAGAIYEEGRFQDLPVLGDALAEAGCTSEAMLRHCREPLIHARGCWLLDSILDGE
jgi:hypothetical protein